VSAWSAQVLDQALTMGQRIEGSSLLSVLVGIAVQAIAIAPYNRRMAAIPVGVARTLANRTGELLSDKAFVRAFLKGERDSLLDLIGTTINSMSQPDQQDGASKQFRSLDSSSRIEWVNHATAIIDGSLDQTRQLLEGPESEWMKMSTPEQIEPFGDKDFDAPKSLKEVEATLRTASSFAGNRQMIQALLRAALSGDPVPMGTWNLPANARCCGYSCRRSERSLQWQAVPIRASRRLVQAV